MDLEQIFTLHASSREKRFEAYLVFGKNESYKTLIRKNKVAQVIEKLIINELRILREENKISSQKLKYAQAPAEVRKAVVEKIKLFQKTEAMHRQLSKNGNAKELAFEILANMKEISAKNTVLKFWEKNGKLPNYQPDISRIPNEAIEKRIKNLKTYLSPSYIRRFRLGEEVQKKHRIELEELMKRG